MNGTIAEIRLFAGDFAPRSWAFCQGQILQIAENTALYSLIGTIYGGDGRVTFALPDLRGRALNSQGTGAGLNHCFLGQMTGQEENVMNSLTMPSHFHGASLSAGTGSVSIPALADTAGTSDPTSAYPATGEDETGNEAKLYSTENPDTTLHDFAANVVGGNVTVSQTGGSTPSTNMQPALVMNYIICLQGVFPSRS